MWDSVLYHGKDFEMYGWQHGLSILFWVGLGLWMMWLARTKWSEDQRINYAVIVASIIAVLQLSETPLTIWEGKYDASDDLPFHLCDILAAIMPFVFYFRSERWWALTYFLVMAGTIQGSFTPSILEDGYPHHEALRYFAVHTGLPMLSLYGAVGLGWRLSWSDALKSLLLLNIMAALVTPLNLLLNTNYFFLRAKPPAGTLLDVLGPWPWYILVLEFLALILFFVLYLPFAWAAKKSQINAHHQST